MACSVAGIPGLVRGRLGTDMNASSWLPLVLGVLAGAALGTQPPINAQLRLVLGSPYWASFVSFLVGTAAMGLYALATRAPLLALSPAGPAQWWAWSGGVLGAFYVTCALILAPRLGAATLVGLVVTGQLLASLAIDHFGLFGLPVHFAGWTRLLGAALLLAGVALIHRP